MERTVPHVGQIRFFNDAATGDPQGIAFNPDDSFERFLIALIDTPAMTRMGRVLQLGGKSTLIGAKHTRRDHMIHAASMARHAMAQLKIAMDRAQPGLYDPRMGMACIAACALHDVGHPPRGHEFEMLVERISWQRFHHEDWSARIIREDQGIQSCFAALFKDHPECGEAFTRDFGMRFDEMVVTLIEGHAPKEWAAYQSIVSGKIDCDRGSFLPMDRAQSPNVDLQTELPADLWTDIEVGQVDGTTVIVHNKTKAEQFLLVWREQYEKIYYSAGSDSKVRMLAPILHDFERNAQSMVAHLSAEEIALYHVLSNDGTATLADYLLLDDIVIDRVIERAAKSSADPWVRNLAQRTLNDDVLPTLDLSFLGKEHRGRLEQYLSAQLPEGMELGRDVFITNAKNRDIAKLHKDYGTPEFEEYNNVAYVRDAAGRIVPVQQASYAVSHMPPLNAFYIHAEPEILEALIPHINDYLGSAEHVDLVQKGDIIHHTAVRKSLVNPHLPAGFSKS